MYATDFEYDGEFLSDYGFIICSFDGVDDVEVVDTGAEISFNRVSVQNGRRQYLVSTSYEDCLSTTFDIMKNPCDSYDEQITSAEYRDLLRWLSRHQFHWFQFINLDEGIEQVFYRASFQMQKILVGGFFNGVRLTMVTDSPWGYGQRVIIQRELAKSGSVSIIDTSDETGNIYPYIKITCGEAGNLELTNQTLGITTRISNCSQNEAITFSGETLIVTSSDSTHDLGTDFNFAFPQIGNTYKQRQNDFVSSLDCTIYVEYRPVVKDVL